MPSNTKKLDESGNPADKKRGRSTSKDEISADTQKIRNTSHGNPK